MTYPGACEYGATDLALRLLVISHTEHYLRNGQVVGWGPTVRELDHLAELFAETRHLCMLQGGVAPPSALPYQSDRITPVLLPPSGGSRLRDKLGILWLAPRYLRTILRELRGADVVHVRCPANISLLALLTLALIREPAPRWIKYAGNWQPTGREAHSYTLQRWWLARNLPRGVVTVNGHWARQPAHIHSFLNPCLSEDELREAYCLSQNKRLNFPVRLLYVGRLEGAKGVGRALQILALLRQDGLAAHLDLAGDGPERTQFEREAADLGVADRVTFYGWMPRPALAPLFAQAHMLLFPSSSSEGWPKVLSEGMAYGVVPVASAVSSIPQVLAENGAGVAVAPDDLAGFARAIRAYVDDPALWEATSLKAQAVAPRFSYGAYQHAVASILAQTWGLMLLEPTNHLGTK